jgi:hypothetical protein
LVAKIGFDAEENGKVEIEKLTNFDEYTLSR